MRKKDILAKIDAHEEQRAAAAQASFVSRQRVRQELEFLQDFPAEYFDLPCIEPRCKICREVSPDRDLRRWLNRALLSGLHHQEIIAHLQARGLSVTPANISNHYRRHVLPYVMDGLRHKAVTSIFIDAARELGHEGSLAEIMVTSLLLKLQPVVEGLDPQQIAEVAPDRLVELLLKTTQALANIQSLEAQTKLRSLELLLKQARLSSAEAQAIQRAYNDLRTAIQAHPDLWQALETVLQPLTQADAPPALPATPTRPRRTVRS